MKQLAVAFILAFTLIAESAETDNRLSSNVVFLKDVKQSYDAAEKWLLFNLRSKGLFNYIYHPKTDEYPNKNNALRQLMASRLLAELSHESPHILFLHRKNLSFSLENWYRENGKLAYVYYDKKSKLGANAFLLRTLVWSPSFDQYQLKAEKLAEGILMLMDVNGAFHPWFIEPGYAYNEDYLLTFYSGEALVALVEYYEKTQNKRYLDAAIKSQAFYIDKYVKQIEKNYYPAYVPWHSISMNKLWKITRNPLYATALFTLNDKLLELLDHREEVGRFYNPATPQYGSPHSSSDGVFTEGLAYAYEMAELMGDIERQMIYKEAITLAISNLIKLQYTQENTAHFNRPDRVVGALKYNAERSGIRIDTVQHAMDAYRKILQVF